jgi:hypothetical protein
MAKKRAEGEPPVPSLSTKDFLKYYLQFYKEGKTQEELYFTRPLMTLFQTFES